MSKTYRLLNSEDGQVVDWTIEQVLEEINRDHSSEWLDYDESDWREGLSEWTPWVEVEGTKVFSVRCTTMAYMSATRVVQARTADEAQQKVEATWGDTLWEYEGTCEQEDQGPEIMSVEEMR